MVSNGTIECLCTVHPALSARELLLVIVSAVCLTTFTGSMINVVLPVIRAEFGASPALIGWVVTGYLLAYAVAVLIFGRAFDQYGVQRLFVIGLTGFAAGGIVCALAPTLPVLVLERTLQGCTGAAVPALATVAVARTFPPGRRGGALGSIASTVGVGHSIGPVVGGGLGDWLGWRGLFGIPIILALILVPFALRFLPANRVPQARRLDAAGSMLVALSAGLCLFSIAQGQTSGFHTFFFWGHFLVAIGAAWALVSRSRRVPTPFVPLELFRNRSYVAALFTGPIANFVNLSLLMLVPLLVIEANGLSSSPTGLLLTPQAMAMALTSPFAGRLSDRVGVRLPLQIGIAVIMLTVAAFSTWAGITPTVLPLFITLFGAGVAWVQSSANNAATNALPEEDVGGGMGMFQGTHFLLGASGPAISGALLAARQQASSAGWNPLRNPGKAPSGNPWLRTRNIPRRR